MDDEEYWFDAKRYGFGAGLPKTWQGWALCAGYGLTIVAAAWLILPRSLIGFLVIVLSATALLLIVSARTTRGGWRWRWGGDDARPTGRSRAKRRS